MYLSDIRARKRKARDQFSEYAWELAFQGSRWFSRGWTFQELLAPDSVEFFSRESKPLGDKRALERQIREIRGIPITPLRGTTLLCQFDVEERFLWPKAIKPRAKKIKHTRYLTFSISKSPSLTASYWLPCRHVISLFFFEFLGEIEEPYWKELANQFNESGFYIYTSRALVEVNE